MKPCAPTQLDLYPYSMADTSPVAFTGPDLLVDIVVPSVNYVSNADQWPTNAKDSL